MNRTLWPDVAIKLTKAQKTLLSPVTAHGLKFSPKPFKSVLFNAEGGCRVETLWEEILPDCGNADIMYKLNRKMYKNSSFKRKTDISSYLHTHASPPTFLLTSDIVIKKHNIFIKII